MGTTSSPKNTGRRGGRKRNTSVPAEVRKAAAAAFGDAVKVTAPIEGTEAFRVKVAGSPAVSAVGRLTVDEDGQATISVDTCAPGVRRPTVRTIRAERAAAERLEERGMDRRAAAVLGNVAVLESAIAPWVVTDDIGLGILAMRTEVLGELRVWLRRQGTDLPVFWHREVPQLVRGERLDADWHGELGLRVNGHQVTGGRSVEGEPWFRIDGGEVLDADEVLDELEAVLA